MVGEAAAAEVFLVTRLDPVEEEPGHILRNF